MVHVSFPFSRTYLVNRGGIIETLTHGVTVIRVHTRRCKVVHEARPTRVLDVRTRFPVQCRTRRRGTTGGGSERFGSAEFLHLFVGQSNAPHFQVVYLYERE